MAGLYLRSLCFLGAAVISEAFSTDPGDWVGGFGRTTGEGAILTPLE